MYVQTKPCMQGFVKPFPSLFYSCLKLQIVEKSLLREEWINKLCVHLYHGIFLSDKKHSVVNHTRKWMNFRSTIQNESLYVFNCICMVLWKLQDRKEGEQTL